MKKLQKFIAVLATTLAATFLVVACNDKPKDPDKDIGDTQDPVKYTVTYNAGGADGTVPESGSYAAGETFTVASAETLDKAGFTFDKWSDGTATYAAGATYTMPASNVTLTATWTEDATPPTPTTKYTVTFDPNNESESWTAEVVEGEKVAKPEKDPIHAGGKAFRYWQTEDGEVYDFDTVVTSDFTLTAAYFYKVTFDVGSATGSVEPMWKKTQGTITLPGAADVTNGDKIFGGWTVNDITYKAGQQFLVEGNVTLTAIWNDPITSFTVSYSTTFYAEGTPPPSETKQVGDTITLPQNTFAPTASYPTYEFKGWYETAVGSSVLYQPGDTYTMPAKNIEFKALFGKSTASVTVTYKAGEHASGADIVETKTKGNRISLPTYRFTPDNTYMFVGWKIEGDTSEKVYSVDEYYTLTANTVFVATYIRAYQNYDNDYRSMLIIYFDHDEDSCMYIFGEAEDGSQDESVAISCTLDAENITVTIDGNDFNGTFKNNVLTISLTYQGMTYNFGATSSVGQGEPTFIFDANGGTGSAPTVSYSYDSAAQSYKYQLPQNTYTAPAGKIFDCWSVNGQKYAAGTNTYAKAGESVTIQAVWKESTVTPDPVPEGVIYEGSCTVPTKTSLGMDIGGETYLKFIVDIDNLKVTYQLSDGTQKTVSAQNSSNVSYKPTNYGNDSYYLSEIKMASNIGYCLLIKSDLSRLYLCNSDDEPLAGGEFIARSDDSEWVSILTGDGSEFKTLCTSNTVFRFDQSFTTSGTEFIGLQFTSNTLGLGLKTIYMSNGVEKTLTSTISYEKNDGSLLIFSSSSYKITIGKKVDGSYYLVSFSYKTDSETTEHKLVQHA